MKYFADVHCHPTMKACGHSFPGGINNNKIKSKSSVWYCDPPNASDKMIDLLGGLAKFRQCSFSAIGFGNVGIALAFRSGICFSTSERVTFHAWNNFPAH